MKDRVPDDQRAFVLHAGRQTYVSRRFTKHGKKQYAVGEVHSYTVESSFSLLKCGLIGTFHHVGEQHLQRYVTEFDFRWNTRTKMGTPMRNAPSWRLSASLASD